MSDTHNELKRYIAKLLEVQQQKREIKLSPHDLKKVAKDMGITESDWAFIQSEINKRYTKGERFLKHRNWDDAIKELRQVVSLSPHHKTALISLGRAYRGRWLKKGHDTDRKNAEACARRCLDIYPEYEAAYQLISSLQNQSFERTTLSSAQREHAVNYPQSGNNVNKIVIVAAAVILLLIGLIGFSLIRADISDSYEAKEEMQMPEAPNKPIIPKEGAMSFDSLYPNEAVTPDSLHTNE